MKKSKTTVNTIGTLPVDESVSVILTDSEGGILLESYAYEVGFFRFNWHPSLEIMLVLEGKLTAYSEQGVFELQEDDLLVINPNIGHASMLQSPRTVALVIHISQAYLEQLCGNAAIPNLTCYSASEADRSFLKPLRASIAAIYTTLSEKSQTGKLFTQSQIYALLSFLLRYNADNDLCPKEQRQKAEQQKLIHTMVKYVNHHFRDKVTLSHLAELSGMNLCYVSTFFKAHTGVGFQDYLTRKRLAYAAYQINNTEDSIADIAMDSGFPDVKAFNQAFRKYFNLSPGHYRSELTKKEDCNVESLFPVRLSVTDPLVRQKLSEYLDMPLKMSDYLSQA